MVVDLIKKRRIKSTFYEHSNTASATISISTIHPIGGGENDIIADIVTQPGFGDNNNVRTIAKKNGLQLLGFINDAACVNI